MKASFTFSIVTNKSLNETLLNNLVQNIYKSCTIKEFVVIFQDQATEIIGDFQEINRIFAEEVEKQSKEHQINNYDVKLKIKFV